MAKPLVIKFSRYLHEDMPGLDLSMVQYRALEGYKRACEFFEVDEIDRDIGICFTLRGAVEKILDDNRDELTEAAKTEDPVVITETMNRLLPDLFSMLVESENDGKIYLRIHKSRMRVQEIPEDAEVEVMNADKNSRDDSDDDVLKLKLAFAPEPIEHLSNAMYRNSDTNDIEIGTA